MRIDLHPLAFSELKASTDWYSARSPIAGQKFALAVNEAFDKIIENPERFVQLDQRHRACRVMNYPFQIVFRFHDERVYVIAVAHAKRRWQYWKDRR